MPRSINAELVVIARLYWSDFSIKFHTKTNINIKHGNISSMFICSWFRFIDHPKWMRCRNWIWTSVAKTGILWCTLYTMKRRSFYDVLVLISKSRERTLSTTTNLTRYIFQIYKCKLIEWNIRRIELNWKRCALLVIAWTLNDTSCIDRIID